MTQIKLINNPQDLQQVFRLRYAVYVEELGAEMEYADHQRKEVREPLEETGDSLGAWSSAGICARYLVNQIQVWEWRNLLTTQQLQPADVAWSVAA